jgi:hypothetical protein
MRSADMIKVERGQVKNGGIVFPEPLGLPDGTLVTVAVQPQPNSGEPQPNSGMSTLPEEESGFESLPFFGIWADRQDMEDSTAWVRQERARWRERVTPGLTVHRPY